ncbi:MAG: pilus assembly protein [Frankiales bacterium]|nr:pilus assembly protein [Frankiales bacterium]
MRDRFSGDSGATAVEFALVIPAAAALIFGGMYVSTYYYYSAAASHVARVVAHDASIPRHGAYPTVADEMAIAHSAAGSFLPDPTSITLTPIPSEGDGNELIVTVTYDLPGITAAGNLLPFLPHNKGTMTRSVTVRYE